MPRDTMPTRHMPNIQGFLAPKKPPPPYDSTVALCLGTYGDPRGVGGCYERVTPEAQCLAPHSAASVASET